MDEDEIKAIINEGTLRRGWISNSYAQVEFMLGDLIMRAREFSQYAVHTETVSHSAKKRVAKVRAMLRIDGPLSLFANEIGNVLDAFDRNHDLRNLLAHGFCEFRYTRNGDSGFYFRKFERGNADNGENAEVLIERTLRPIDLHYHETQLTHEAGTALAVFAKVYHHLGWEFFFRR